MPGPLTKPSTISSRWETAFGNQGFADGNHARLVRVKDLDRGPSEGSESNENSRPPGKMLSPLVAPRMIEANDFLGHRIDSGDVRAFMHVAMDTAEGQVRERVAPAVLTGDDMVDLVSQPGSGLGELTVLAAMPYRWRCRYR